MSGSRVVPTPPKSDQGWTGPGELNNKQISQVYHALSLEPNLHNSSTNSDPSADLRPPQYQTQAENPFSQSPSNPGLPQPGNESLFPSASVVQPGHKPGRQPQADAQTSFGPWPKSEAGAQVQSQTRGQPAAYVADNSPFNTLSTDIQIPPDATIVETTLPNGQIIKNSKGAYQVGQQHLSADGPPVIVADSTYSLDACSRMIGTSPEPASIIYASRHKRKWSNSDAIS